ncbi:MAG: hypothetical protein Q7T22_09345 [Serpentinimonas sp.]|nr:hypothetical protein [Serpentinimonas sp.]MDO9611924.1 hypothetical protein [Serpentinimonas sp.]
MYAAPYLKRINLNALVDPAHPVRSGSANSDILKSPIPPTQLLMSGKTQA